MHIEKKLKKKKRKEAKMEWIRFGFCAFFIGLGVISILLAVFGVYKFKFVLNRMHSTAMIDTLGVLFIALGLMIANGLSWDIAKIAMIVIILWITSPLTSHVVSKFELEIHKDEVEDSLSHNLEDEEDYNGSI